MARLFERSNTTLQRHGGDRRRAGGAGRSSREPQDAADRVDTGAASSLVPTARIFRPQRPIATPPARRLNAAAVIAQRDLLRRDESKIRNAARPQRWRAAIACSRGGLAYRRPDENHPPASRSDRSQAGCRQASLLQDLGRRIGVRDRAAGSARLRVGRCPDHVHARQHRSVPDGNHVQPATTRGGADDHAVLFADPGKLGNRKCRSAAVCASAPASAPAFARPRSPARPRRRPTSRTLPRAYRAGHSRRARVSWLPLAQRQAGDRRRQHRDRLVLQKRPIGFA